MLTELPRAAASMRIGSGSWPEPEIGSTCRSWRPRSLAVKAPTHELPRRAVPSKRILMQGFGVAGGTVDKAIDILREEGLVRTVTGRGIYVVPPSER
jgi:hypothetical protein